MLHVNLLMEVQLGVYMLEKCGDDSLAEGVKSGFSSDVDRC